MFTLSVLLGMVHLLALFGDGLTYDLPKPVLSLNPPYEVFFNGETLNLTCRCQCPLTLNHYYRGQLKFLDRAAPKGQCETFFDFKADQRYEGSYTCECLHSLNGDWSFSERSEPVQLIFRDRLPEPTIYMDPDSDAVSNGDNVAISCKGDIRSRGGTFLLYKDHKAKPVQSRTVSGDERIVTFNINTQSEGSVGSYSCRYQTEVAGLSMFSPFSKDVPIMLKEQYLMVSLVRLCLSVLVVILMVTFIVEHFVNGMSPKGKESLDKTPSPDRHNSQNMVIMFLD